MDDAQDVSKEPAPFTGTDWNRVAELRRQTREHLRRAKESLKRLSDNLNRLPLD